MQLISQEDELDSIFPRYTIGDSVSFSMLDGIHSGIILEKRQGKNKDIISFYYVINYFDKINRNNITMIEEDSILYLSKILLVEIISEYNIGYVETNYDVTSTFW